MKSGPQLRVVPTDPNSRESLIDEYAELRQKMRAWNANVNPYAARFDELNRLILSWYEDHPADRSAIAEGRRWKLPITARRWQRSIQNLAGFFRKVGRERFLELCSVTLGAIEKEISADKLELYIHSEQSGNRSIGEPVERDVRELAEAA